VPPEALPGVATGGPAGRRHRAGSFGVARAGATRTAQRPMPSTAWSQCRHRHRLLHERPGHNLPSGHAGPLPPGKGIRKPIRIASVASVAAPPRKSPPMCPNPTTLIWRPRKTTACRASGQSTIQARPLRSRRTHLAITIRPCAQHPYDHSAIILTTPIRAGTSGVRPATGCYCPPSSRPRVSPPS